ncbi:hypothetical protein P2318_23730 [Myxococcaceae bacterium GXIMD 01537]
MSPRALTRAAALAALLAQSSALAQSRPSEESLFGGGEETPAPAPAAPERPSEDSLFGDGPEKEPPGDTSTQRPSPSQAGAASPGDRDASVMDGPAARNAFETAEATEDPLKIGGMFYLRAAAAGGEGVSFGNTTLSAPTLVDGYFDARPTDRIRGMVVGRMTFDPTVTSGGSTSNPRVLLDQAWLRFDIEHAVFVTVGKQHVKWGTSRFWNPTDFLSPQRRDPLAVFDARTGASMLKIHVPWEAKGWNFYALGMLDNAGPANSLGRVGGALRAEMVLGETELGLSAVAQRGLKPRYGIDISSALGPLDVYAEMALRRGSDLPMYRLPAGTTLETLFSGDLQVERYFPSGLTPQVSGGATYSFAYAENELATVGVEYFYNELGYPTEIAYPYLLAQGQFQPFYLGKHYGAVYAVVAGPGSWDRTTFVLSNLGNLSDRSFISRLDVTHRALSYLSVEGFTAVHYGRKGGEFRFGLDIPPVVVDGQAFPGFKQPAPTLELGVGLRVNL